MTSDSAQLPPEPIGPRISAVIVARNEEDKIAYALASVRPLAHEILCFDMDSNDKTGEIAASYGAIVTRVPPMIGQEPVRPEAVAQATGDWVLMFDADEILSPLLRRRLLRIARQDEADVVQLPRFNYLFGKPLHGALMGANDDRQIRFFKKGAVAVSPLLHLQPTVQPGRRLKALHYPEDGAIIHFNYVNVESYLTKLNRYTEMEAAKPEYALVYSSAPKTLLLCLWEIWKRYVLKKGYRDGWRGLYVSLAMGFYRLTIWARIREFQEVGSKADIQEIYRTAARSALEEGSATD